MSSASTSKHSETEPRASRRGARPHAARSHDDEKERELEKEKEVEKSLEAIYQDEDGHMPDLTSFEPPRRVKWTSVAFLVFSVFAFLGALAFGVIRIFDIHFFRGFDGQAMAVQMEGPERVALGEETTYFINYQNTSPYPLASAEVHANFPAEFTVTGAEPAPQGEGLNWRLGSLVSQGRGTIKVKGIFHGALGMMTAVQVVASYRPATFNSDFEALTSKTVEYSESVLDAVLEMPPKILPGDRIGIAYHLTNRGTDPVDGQEVRLTLPAGFTVDPGQKAIASSDGRVVTLPLGPLAGGTSTTMVVTGSFASGAAGEAKVLAEVGAPSPAGGFQAMQRTETSATVLSGDLSLKMVVNGADGDVPVSYGSRLNIALAFENTSPEPLGDVRIHLRFEPTVSSTAKIPALVDWKRLSMSASGTRQGNEIVWTSAGVGMLARLAPHQNGTVEITLDALPVTAGSNRFGANVVAFAEIGNVGDAKTTRVIRAPLVTLRYVTDARGSQTVRYFTDEGAPYRGGPLPPLAGQETMYRVQWDLKKKFHEVQRLSFSTVLPSKVTWGGNGEVGAGELKYDIATRTVTWSLNRVPDGVHETQAAFDIILTPTDADVGTFAQLLNETKIEFTDGVVGKTLTQKAAPVRSDIPDDAAAKGKGVVKRP